MMETQHWLIDSRDCNYLPEQDVKRLLGICEEIGRMFGSMIRKSESFASADYTQHEQPPLDLINDSHDDR